MEEGLGSHFWVLLLLQLSLLWVGVVEKMEDKILQVSGATPGGVEGHQGEEVTPVHALCGGMVQDSLWYQNLRDWGSIRVGSSQVATTMGL